MPDDPTSFIGGLQRAYSEATGAGLKTDFGEEGVLESVLGDVIVWFFGIAAVVALGALVYGAFLYITSLGNDKQTESAKRVILYAIIGLLVLGISFVVLGEIKDLITNSS